MGFGSRCPTIAQTFSVFVSHDTAIEHVPSTVPAIPALPKVETVDPSGMEVEAFKQALEAASARHRAAVMRVELGYRTALIAWANESGIEDFDLTELVNASMTRLRAYATLVEKRHRLHHYWKTGELSHIGEVRKGREPYRFTVHAPTPEAISVYLDAPSHTNTLIYHANLRLVAECLTDVTGDFAAEGWQGPTKSNGKVSGDWIRLIPLPWIHELASLLRYMSEPDNDLKKG